MLLPADPLREGALTVVRTLRAAGFQALFAGGCVRDRVLGLAPQDYDIATDARPESVMELFAKAIPVGVQFGVVRVLVEHREYEVATFRAETDYDGRRPGEVRWADARADVLRRDFTINGLLEDPLAPGGGEVIDFVGGRADLEAGLVRAIGEPLERFGEDFLRLLRCVRFAARMAFQIDPPTWHAVLELAPYIHRISPERVAEELDRVVTQGHQSRGLALLGAAGLLGHVLPELGEGERFERAVARMRHLGPCTPVLGWGALLLDVGHGGDGIEALGRRLRWSRALSRGVTEAVGAAHAIARWPELGVADKKRTARLPTFGEALVIAGSAGHRTEEELAKADLARWADEDLRPRPLLNGEDLKAAGHRPGPRFSFAIQALETAQLDGRAATREEAWAVVEAVLKD